MAKVIKMIELQNEDRAETLILVIGTSNILSNPVTPEAKWEPLLVCFLNEVKEKTRPRLVVSCTIHLNPDAGLPIADFMNGNLTRWNIMVMILIAENPNELRLMDIESALRMVDHRKTG